MRKKTNYIFIENYCDNEGNYPMKIFFSPFLRKKIEKTGRNNNNKLDMKFELYITFLRKFVACDKKFFITHF